MNTIDSVVCYCLHMGKFPRVFTKHPGGHSKVNGQEKMCHCLGAVFSIFGKWFGVILAEIQLIMRDRVMAVFHELSFVIDCNDTSYKSFIVTFIFTQPVLAKKQSSEKLFIHGILSLWR